MLSTKNSCPRLRATRQAPVGSTSLGRLPLGLVATLFLASLLAVGCGGTAEGGDAAGGAAGGDEAAATSTSSSGSGGVAAAKAAGQVETKYFKTVLPEGWEIMADDMEKMGLMTLAEKGTGGKQGVYMKVEGGGSYSGDPLAAIEKFAASYEGSPAASEKRGAVEWAGTCYTYSGVEQCLNITAHDGYKITFTVMGRSYDEDPGVKAIFDGLSFG